MFFYASKFFSLLFFPLPLFLLLSAPAFFLLQLKKYKYFYGVVWLAFCLLCVPALASLCIRPLEMAYAHIPAKEAPQADAIVLLTGMADLSSTRAGQVEFTSAVDRILYALELYRNGKARFILISGGSGHIAQRSGSEAELLSHWLAKQGVPASSIVVEPNSRNTLENAVESAKILDTKQAKSILLVTSAFHMPRSMRCFRAQNISAFPLPTDYKTNTVDVGIEAYVPSDHGLAISTIAIKEYMGLVAYRLKGYY